MRNVSRLALLLAASSLTSLGCHAQAPAPPITGKIAIGSPLPLSVSRRVEVLLRQKAQLPPGSDIHVSDARPSDFPGYYSVTVTFVNEGQTSRPIDFLVSADGKTLAQFNKYDISADPRSLLPIAGRPGRGGPDSAPVLIVGFDDLECPYCARLHETIFPALLNRYGDKIHIVYDDFPLEQHPWAMRAAVDVNCLGAQSPTGYWNLVDYIHAHAGDIGAAPPSPADTAGKDDKLGRANRELDTLTKEQGKLQKVDGAKLDACINKQDTSGIQQEQKLASTVNIESTPTLFINGAKIDGALPIGYIDDLIDDALRAEGVAPPPPYVAPAAPGAPPLPSAVAAPPAR